MQPSLFQDEMRSVGVNLQQLINSGSIELHYSEFGLGGGGRYTGAFSFL